MGCLGRKSDPQKEASKVTDKKIAKWMRTYQEAIKILLLGPGESGKTTIIKQMKLLHINGFSEEERKEKTEEIRKNLLESIRDLCGNMAFLNPPVVLSDPNLKDSFDFIQEINMMQDDNHYHFPQEFYEHTKLLWADEGIQACYRRSSEFQLIDCAKYFLDQVAVIQSETYSPSDQDILWCRKRTSDIQKIEFEVKPQKGINIRSTKQQKFWMFDVGGQRGERRKWITVFDGISAVLFLAACSGFDGRLREDPDANRMEEALKVFEEVWFSRFLKYSGFILFLNKQDALETKIRQGARVEEHFPEYLEFSTPSTEDGDHTDEYIKARSFFKHKFLSITSKPRPSARFSVADLYCDTNRMQLGRECYWHYTTATDTDNIDKVFRDVHAMIILSNINVMGGNLS